MRNYVVVGGSSGTGLEIVRQLTQQGHHVTATYLTHPQQGNSHAIYHRWDAKSDAPFGDILPEVVDGLVYCPGAIQLKPFHRFKDADYLADYQLQVVGAARAIRESLPHLKRSSSASVVLFSTVAVQKGYPFHAQVSASKGALEGLTRALAAELAPSIRVNAIAPSLTDTPLSQHLLKTPEKKENLALQNPLKRLGQPEDLAHMATFLLSPNSSWITGQILAVDGGASSLK